ncbi:mitogen-activated protein kinase kinase kinase 5-like isoform X2 [Ananas comosus]|nr:mitogen-activated protein kinase kinase kinase 5-like isoform X2 [Ananas comosus]
MRWWKSSNPPPSSSSSSTASSVSSAASPSRGRESQPRLTRQRKLRYLDDAELGSLASFDSSADPVRSPPPPRSSSSPPVLSPHPLPLPEAAAAAAQLSSVGCPLPSPRGWPGRAEGEAGIVSARDCVRLSLSEPVGGERASSVSPVGRLAYQTARRSTGGSDVLSNGSAYNHHRKLFQDMDTTETEDFKLNIPAKSAPTSGLASPVRSPRRSSNGLNIWSAPAIPSMDSTTTTLSCQTSPERIFSNSGRSARYSPTTKNTIWRSSDSSAPPSPVHSKMFPDNSVLRHDSNGSANVHPLPLPPGAAVPLHSPAAHRSALKAEASPMTGQWQKGKLIGSGTFGNVYVATNRQTGALCAMKEVNIIADDSKSAECLKQLEQEIKFLSQFKHQNIVQYYGSEIIDDRFHIYLEYVHPGSINKYVRQHCGAMTESVVRNFTRHILNGLTYLHSKKIMHRDIKGANLLVDANGVVKLADFGMAKHLSDAAPNLSLKGTPYWMAPEVVQATMKKDAGYDLAVDIWSLGCTIIEMFTGKHPWSGLEGAAAMFRVLHKDPPIPDRLSSEGKDFLRRCFRRNPVDRPTATMLLDHPFIRNSHHYNLHGSIHSFAGIKLI